MDKVIAILNNEVTAPLWVHVVTAFACLVIGAVIS